MKQRNWIKPYGIHLAVCALIVGIAFGINQRINIKKSHVYTISDTSYTLLKEITEVKTEGNILTLTGWGFDIDYYGQDNTCELILRDTETGESFWPKMGKALEPVQIAERYTEGKDYSAACFKGTLKADRLNPESVYEILLRYTSDYQDENGKNELYVKAVTTDTFVYKGEMAEYNPKTFEAPEIEGTELEKELENAKLFHYFPEGMWVYYDGEELYYIIEKAILEKEKTGLYPVRWYVKNNQELPEESKPYGFGNSDFYTDSPMIAYVGDKEYGVVVIPISKHVTYVHTGLYAMGTTGWKFQKMKQLID